MKLSNIIFFFCSIALIIILVLISKNNFSEISGILNEQYLSFRWRERQDIAFICLLFSIFQIDENFKLSSGHMLLLRLVNNSPTTINNSDDLFPQALHFATLARNDFQDLLDRFASDSLKGIPVYTTGEIYFKENIP
jgi:hypothetical protein